MMLLDQKRKSGERMYIQIEINHSRFSYEFKTGDEIRGNQYVMKSNIWDIFPRKKFLYEGDFFTRLIFENDKVVCETEIGNSLGGPLQFILMRMFAK